MDWTDSFVPDPFAPSLRTGPWTGPADFVGLGEVLYYLLTRQTGAHAKTPAPDGVNPDLFNVIRRCLAQMKDPIYLDFAEVKAQSHAVLNPPPPLLPPPVPLKKAPSGHLSRTVRDRTVDVESTIGVLVSRLLSQPLPYLGLQTTAVLVGVIWLWLS